MVGVPATATELFAVGLLAAVEVVTAAEDELVLEVSLDASVPAEAALLEGAVVLVVAAFK